MYVRQEGSKGDISILHLEVLVRTIVSPFCLIRQGREETPFIPEERRKKKIYRFCWSTFPFRINVAISSSSSPQTHFRLVFPILKTEERNSERAVSDFILRRQLFLAKVCSALSQLK